MHTIKNIEMFKKVIKKFKKGTYIYPKLLGMESARYNFYHWAKKLKKEKILIKIGDKFFVT